MSVPQLAGSSVIDAVVSQALSGSHGQPMEAPLALAGGGTVTLILPVIVAIAGPAARRVRPEQVAQSRLRSP